MKFEDEFSAFPVRPGFPKEWHGLTKLEMLAGMTMQGLLADPNRDLSAAEYAEDAVKYAETLLKVLERRSQARRALEEEALRRELEEEEAARIPENE